MYQSPLELESILNYLKSSIPKSLFQNMFQLNLNIWSGHVKCLIYTFFKKDHLILRVNWRWNDCCIYLADWEWCWSYFGVWSWRPFWQLFIALNRAATILCNQGVVFWGSWNSALSFFSSFTLYDILKIWRPGAKQKDRSERSK